MIAIVIILICIIITLAILLYRTHVKVQETMVHAEKMTMERDKARHESEAKDVYVQNMSHEVRTPLNAVVGFAQLLTLPQEFLTDEERNEYCEHIQHNSNLLTMLIDDILDISDIQGGNYRITPSECSLSDICNVSIGSVKYRVKDNIELGYSSSIPADYKIFADPRRVQQILINYLTNAIKHTKEGSIKLTTSLTEYPGMVTFAVEDTGEGVPIEQASNIFRRFTKLNDFVQGTGLGLNICRTLAEKMNGKVFLDTTYINGARFVFCLPIEKKSEE